MNWQYGITTVPARLETTFPRTLGSLQRAGFDRPRLFVDGCDDPQRLYGHLGLPITSHSEPVFVYGNWLTAMWELFVRDPFADRYALFQDDFVTCRNLRAYLERCPYPARSYLNLYTFPKNQRLSTGIGWFTASQNGLGAVALVFDNAAASMLLSSSHLVNRRENMDRWPKYLDGAIVTAMKKAGFVEACHNPSLVQHTGEVSSCGNGPQALAETFPGEEFDAISLLGD